jgi:DNA-binding transcriptional ArsR family regulator
LAAAFGHRGKALISTRDFTEFELARQGYLTLAQFIDGSSVRRHILERLASGPMTPTELASLEKKHVSHVSRALREMTDHGIVEPMSGHSRERYYQLTTPGYLAYAALSRVG